MEKRLILPRGGGALLKSHVKGYTRKDGTPVAEHDDKRQKKAAEAYSHPHSVGKAEITDTQCEGFSDCSAIKFAGTQYFSTGKSGKSFHDETPVREFESEDSHRIWVDDHGRVHADSKSEVQRLRQKHEAHQASEQETDAPIDDKDRFDAGEGDPVHDEQKKGGEDVSPNKDPASPDAGVSGGDKPKSKSKPKSKPKEKGGDFAALKSHPMFSASDLEYFKGKGYTADEIKEIWDRDKAAGHKPVEHEAQPDVAGDHAKFLEKKDKESGGNLFKSLREEVSRLVLGRGK